MHQSKLYHLHLWCFDHQYSRFRFARQLSPYDLMLNSLFTIEERATAAINGFSLARKHLRLQISQPKNKEEADSYFLTCALDFYLDEWQHEQMAGCWGDSSSESLGQVSKKLYYLDDSKHPCGLWIARCKFLHSVLPLTYADDEQRPELLSRCFAFFVNYGVEWGWKLYKERKFLETIFSMLWYYCQCEGVEYNATTPRKRSVVDE